IASPNAMPIAGVPSSLRMGLSYTSVRGVSLIGCPQTIRPTDELNSVPCCAMFFTFHTWLIWERRQGFNVPNSATCNCLTCGDFKVFHRRKIYGFYFVIHS